MNAFSLGPRIEATASIMESVTVEELASLLHGHRTFDYGADPVHMRAKAAYDDIDDLDSFRTIVIRSKELEDRSMRIINMLVEISEDDDEQQMDYVDRLDYNLRRYLGTSVVSKFNPSKRPDDVGFIITSLGGVRHFDRMNTDRRVIPHYSTFVAMDNEAVDMILFANGNHTVAANKLITSEFYGLEDVTQDLFVLLLSEEMAV